MCCTDVLVVIVLTHARLSLGADGDAEQSLSFSKRHFDQLSENIIATAS